MLIVHIWPAWKGGHNPPSNMRHNVPLGHNVPPTYAITYASIWCFTPGAGNLVFYARSSGQHAPHMLTASDHHREGHGAPPARSAWQAGEEGGIKPRGACATFL